MRALLILAASCAFLAGCTSADSEDDADVLTAESSASVLATPDGDAPVTPVDVCSFVSSEDIAALIGVTVDGESNSVDPRVPGCVWQNNDTYESVTINVGSPGSAPDNVLPRLGEPGFPEIESTPGPDGSRFVGGALEFPAANRFNSVQVAAVSMDQDTANAAMIDLANKVRPQIPA